jgi:exonuclease SbcC
MLLLTLPSDVAAFSVFNAHAKREFEQAYSTFKSLYRENSREWDLRTLSFVVCRSSEHADDDRFYAGVEHDPMFCRKYVIRAHDDVRAQRDELLRLPFFPLRARGSEGMERPQSAQDFLQSAGVSVSLSRKLIEVGYRSAERIALDVRGGNEALPEGLTQPRQGRMALTRPRAHSRLVSLSVEGFRVYKQAQTFDLDGSVVVLYGPNGLGKTSLFDAIDYASTGRIGRLCGRKRSQVDFSRIATHLDKTPGSGSVVLTGRSSASDASIANWKLQRGTGNWSTAWLDGEQVDRKTVLNRLTQANWPDTIPRQQTLESLFRATHLFGQDEQELLNQFQKDSVIPESFISEMLALQDYSQGLAKVTDVLAQLSADRTSVNAEITQVRLESSNVVASLPQLAAGDSADAEPTPIENALADLRRQIVTAGVFAVPSEPISFTSLSEWHEVVSARLVEMEGRIQIARDASNELPVYQRRLEEAASEHEQLEHVDREIEGAQADEREIKGRIDANAKALDEAERGRNQREQGRRDLRAFQELQAERRDLSTQAVSLQGERDRQALERSEIDSRLIVAESTLSRALADHAAAERQVGACRSRLAETEALLGALPHFAGDQAIAKDLRDRLAKAKQDLQDTQSREAEAARSLQEIRGAREALLPQY